LETVPIKSLYLDTHILVWLYQDGATRLTPLAVNAIEEAEQLLISPMVELELTYLHEISRINCPALNILDSSSRHRTGNLQTTFRRSRRRGVDT